MDKFNTVSKLVQRIVILFLVKGPAANGSCFFAVLACLLLLHSLVQVDTILIHYLVGVACFDFIAHLWIDYQNRISTSGIKAQQKIRTLFIFVLYSFITYKATENNVIVVEGNQLTKAHFSSNFQVLMQRPVATSQTLTDLSLLADNSHWPE